MEQVDVVITKNELVPNTFITKIVKKVNMDTFRFTPINDLIISKEVQAKDNSIYFTKPSNIDYPPFKYFLTCLNHQKTA